MILLNPDGSLLTNEGRSIIIQAPFDSIGDFIREKEAAEQRAAIELAQLKENFNVYTYLSDAKIIGSEGSQMESAQLTGKMIGLYFSAHWLVRF